MKKVDALVEILRLWRSGARVEAITAYRANVEARGELYSERRARGYFGAFYLSHEEWEELILAAPRP